MASVAQTRDFVVGVDTHARSHTYAVLATSTGQTLGIKQFPSTSGGIARALNWVGRTTGGDLDTLWVVECVATYGAAIARAAAHAGYPLVEAPRMDSRARRGVGKSDPLDAQRMATAVLALEVEQLRHPRADNGIRAALRFLTAAREQMTTEKTAYLNALTAIVRATELGIDARKPLTTSQVHEISAWRHRAEELSLAIARAEAKRLARRILALEVDLDDNQTQLTDLVKDSPAAPLLDIVGVGPVTAAVIYTAWSHPGRLRNEAAFAALAGVNPIPASSGNTTRHRLNRGGDRRINRALHMAAVTRMAHDPETRAYVQRRKAEGLSTKEFRRCIKRYLARRLYRALEASSAMMAPA